MCGRASVTTSYEQLGKLVRARSPFPPFRPRYNQGPGEPVGNVIEANGIRRVELLVWGIRGREPKRPPYINVRSESVARSRAFSSRRALFFVDSFFEWDKAKQPYLIRRDDHQPMALATVFDESKDHRRFAVITTPPNATVGEVHDRMPAILPESAWACWLDPQYPDTEELHALLRPFPDEPLLIYPVNKAVNSVKNDRRELLEPIGPMPRIVALQERVP
jgi:putative SOS response-associated peptidase YedK